MKILTHSDLDNGGDLAQAIKSSASQVDVYTAKKDVAAYDLVVVDAGQDQDFLLENKGQLLDPAHGGADLLVLNLSAETNEDFSDAVGLCRSGDLQALFVGMSGGDGHRIITLPGAADAALSHDLIRAYLAQLVAHQTAAPGGGTEPQAAPDGLLQWTFKISDMKSFAKGLPRYPNRSTILSNYDIRIFLNDPPDGEHYQYILVEHNSHINPGEFAADHVHARGWSQIQAANSIGPRFGENLVLQHSSPKNVADQIEVTTSSEFNVNFNQKGATGSYKFATSQKRKIQDWKITERTRALTGSWQYDQVLPWDASKKDDSDGAFYWDFFDGWRVREIDTALSRNTLQMNTQALWRTKEVTKEKIPFITATSQKLGLFWVEHEHPFDFRRLTSYLNNTLNVYFTVDMGKVYRQP